MARGVGGKLALLVLLVVVGGGLWFFRGMIPGPWQPDPVVITEVSEERRHRRRGQAGAPAQ